MPLDLTDELFSTENLKDITLGKVKAEIMRRERENKKQVKYEQSVDMMVTNILNLASACTYAKK